MSDARQIMLKKVRKYRSIMHNGEEMLELLEAIRDAYNYGEIQPLWNEIDILINKINKGK